MSSNSLDDTFSGIFPPKKFSLYFATQFLTEYELLLFMVWNNSSLCSDNTKSSLILIKIKVLQKHYHVTSKHNTDQSETHNTMDNSLF